MTTVRTGGVLGTLAGGAAAVRGLASKKNVDTSMPAMTTSKPVFQVRTVCASCIHLRVCVLHPSGSFVKETKVMAVQVVVGTCDVSGVDAELFSWVVGVYASAETRV